MRAVTVTPRKLSQEGEEIRSIDWSQSKVDWAYYSDTRVSGSITVYGRWPKNQWIRIYDDDGPIGTFIPTKWPAERVQGEWKTMLELHSMLWGLGQCETYGDWTVAKGTYASTVYKRMAEWYGYEFDLSGMAEYKSSKVTVLEGGKTLLSWNYATSNYTGNRLDQDPWGRITVKEAVAPAKIPQTHYVSLEDGIIGGLSRSSDDNEIPGRVQAIYENENGSRIVAYVDATGDASMESRGYLSTKTYNLSEVSPANYSGVLAYAKRMAALNSNSITTWTMRGKEAWYPGEGVTINVDDPMYPGDRQCFVRNLGLSRLDLDRPIYDLTLKETIGRDEEDAA